jgi:hypothetical protein
MTRTRTTGLTVKAVTPMDRAALALTIGCSLSFPAVPPSSPLTGNLIGSEAFERRRREELCRRQLKTEQGAAPEI